MDHMGHFHQISGSGESDDHQRLPGTRSGKTRFASSRHAPLDSRARVLLTAISRLEQEHVALLMALCELEGASAKSQDVAMLSALEVLLRDDLRRTQHALGRAAQGTYGICEVCQQPLSRRHLSLLPAITRCWACTGRVPREH